ncbi:CHASE3 domain-containing protein [bacterium]|nr:CHASE3 domain-containing protein [bacterium]
MTRATRNWIVLCISLLASVLILSCSVLFREVTKLRDNSGWVAHTHEAMAKIEKLLSDIRDAETGQRGYLLTGDSNYLFPFDLAMSRYESDFKDLKTLLADNKDQLTKLDQLQRLIEAKLNEVKETIRLRKEGNLPAAIQIVETDKGRQTMRGIRDIVDQMESTERDLLAQRVVANEGNYQSALRNIFLSMIIGVASLVLLGYLLHAYLRNVEESTDLIFREQQLLKATLVSIGDAVIATDADGNIRFLNSIAEELTGWRQEEAVGIPLEQVFRIVNEETRQAVDNPALRALREGKIVGLANHTILIGKDGKERPIDDSAAPIRTSDGVIEGAILCFRDVSEKKDQEAALRRQSLALLEADKRKNEFLAVLAHELRNPLSPLSNSIQVWPFVKNDPAEMDRLHALMERQINQMTRLIDDLLDVSRITRGKIQLRMEEVDLVSVLRSSIDVIRPTIESNSQHLEVSFPDSLVLVEGDSARLNQIFGNILNNAAKYTGRGGNIAVKIEVMNGEATVSIKDDGPGIPPELLDEIFEMFRQVDGTLDRSRGGMGIGLTLVKRLVEQHGGTVNARSEGKDKGSEFFVKLPTRSSKESTESIVNPAAVPISSNHPFKHRILVVDDVKASAHTLALMLQKLGQEVEQVHDGPTAIHWTLKHRPDVVFLDISMPVMDGYEVASRLRAETTDVTLVALTGYGQEEDKQRAFDAGFDHHLVKPTSMERLVSLLASISKSDDGEVGSV